MDRVRVAEVFAGIRGLFLVCQVALGRAALGLVWFGLVCFAFVVAGIRVSAYAAQALPLCGAALTFFAAAKKVSKESGLTPPALVPA